MVDVTPHGARSWRPGRAVKPRGLNPESAGIMTINQSVDLPDVADVLVVGAGASGSVAVKALAQAGFSVVCLEQGDWTPPSAFAGD